MRRAFAVLILAIMTASAAAGCLQSDATDPTAPPPSKKRVSGTNPDVYEDKLSKPEFLDQIKERVQVPSFDGKKMDNWVYRPKTDEGTKVPVFINFSPYWSNAAPSAESRGDAFSRHMIDYFVPRGYAVVLSSVRGTGFSEGCFNIGGDIEKKDAVAVIDYFAKQSWSNGNVGAGGKSYDGTTPQGAATLAHPALKAIFPVSGISELYKYNYKGGIPFGQGAIFNTYYYAGESAAPPGAQTPLFMADRVACPELPEMQASGVLSGATGDYRLAGQTNYWVERNYSKDAGKVKAALFFVHGFTDWNVKPDHILPWLNNIPKDTPVKAWLHNWTSRDVVKGASGDGHVYPKRDDWNVTMLRFLDETLKGIETGIFDEPAFQIQDSDNVWRWEEEWPPARAVSTKYYLTFKDGRGSLDPILPTRSEIRTFTDNGQGPGGANAAGGTNFIRYETPPLEKDIHYAGVPHVYVKASTDKAVGKIVALLYDVGPDGKQELINWGGLNFRHRLALENPQPVVPNTVYGINVELFPQDDVIRAGHSLVLYLAGSGGGYLGIPYQATVSVTQDDKAFLDLPLIETFDYEEPQPVRIPCFAC